MTRGRWLPGPPLALFQHRNSCRLLSCRAGVASPPPRPVEEPPASEEVVPPPGLPSPGWSRAQLLAFSTTFVAYAACYLARNNAAVAKSVLSTAGLSDLTMGNLDAAFLIAYTAGSFALGSVTDRLGAWPALAGGLLGSGLCQGGLALLGTTEAAPLAAFYAFNGLFQSILYPACKKIMGDNFDASKGRGAALGGWSTCYYLGSIASTALASHLLATYHGAGPDSWRVVFMAPALVLPLLALATVPVRAALEAETRAETGIAATPRLAPLPAVASSSHQVLVAPSTADSDGADHWLGYPPAIWMTALSYALVKCTRYAFFLWLPLYLVADVHLSFQQAAFTAALFDVGSVGGSLLGGVLSDRLGQQAGLCTALLAPLAAILCALPVVADSTSPAALPVAILALGLCIGGAETLQGAVAPLRYSSPHRRAASVGFVNGWGSVGTVVAAPAIPAVAAAVGGIQHAFSLLGPLAAMAGAVTFLQWAVYDAKDSRDVEQQ